MRTTRRRTTAVLAGLLGIVASARADAPPPEADGTGTAGDRTWTADEVAQAPLPGDESGRVDDTTPRESRARAVAREVLGVPRFVLSTALAPARAGAWVYERYQLDERVKRWLFNDAGTFGGYPVVQLDAGYGVNIGGRLRHTDLLGRNERMRLRGGFGGRWSQLYEISLDSGARLGDRVRIGIDAEYERRPKEAFYGVGNLDMDPSALDTRYRERSMRVAAVADLDLGGAWSTRGSAAVADWDLAASDAGVPVAERYPAVMLGSELRQTYGELELRHDTRERQSRWEPASVRSGGWLVSAFTGRAEPSGSVRGYWRFGTDVQAFRRLGGGPRVLSARLAGETVTAAVPDIAFHQLPALGGRTLLRGYPLNRFRDRVAVVGSLEYGWDLTRFVSASAFVDAGRVYPSLDAIALDDVRVGYGIGLEAHTNDSFLFRAILATSVDGGVFLDLAFDPVFDLPSRVERR